ncbi:MAG TPA: proline--tRNA ligase [Anaerolineales bacterium]|nr:proline--tRNA ligase [Anaerolineales bacterium]
MSAIFGQTLRDAPSEADVASHQLLLRAGFIRPLGAGIFSSLHLGKRVAQKIEAILREEMDAIGGQEISMPVVQPADLWKETGRWYQIGSEMGRFKDKNDHDMVLAMTHEEAVADLVRREIQSYKQLPRLVYHIQTKWRDDPRPRAGLIRVREFTMKDSYSLDADWAGLEKQYRAHYQAYFNIYRRCGLDVIAVRSDTGMMGGKLAHEYMYLSPIGEDSLLICKKCGYTANRQVARFRKPAAASEEPRAIDKVKTPECKSIEDLANFLGVPKARTAKAVFFMATVPDGEETTEQFVFAVVRGDMELNETKLANAVHARDLRPATEEEIRAIGAVPGFASPVGLKNVLTVVDDILPASPNLVAGANETDYHLLNINYGRDYSAALVTDLAAADEGSACPECGAPMGMSRGVEVGNIFQLGTRYSDALGCTYLDHDGQPKPVVMGSYGIGVGRLLACAAEAHHDEGGLVWPVTIAPYQVHLVLLRGKGDTKNESIADKLYSDLLTAGFEVLYDDRDESPGVKFNDADLIGLPLRVTVSERALGQGGLELKLRTQPDKTIVPLADLLPRLRGELERLQAELAATIVPVEYNG